MFDEIISLSLIVIIAVPYIMLIKDMNIRWLYVILSIFIVERLQSIIKEHSKAYDYEFLKRPIGAQNCDLFSRNGLVEGQPGFPSGHVGGTVAFFMTVYLLFPEYRKYWYFAVVWTLLMMWSRISKKCHTLLQTIAGFGLGVIVPVMFSKLIKMLL
jgi:membrane-associated phospholipid phosphatase